MVMRNDLEPTAGMRKTRSVAAVMRSALEAVSLRADLSEATALNVGRSSSRLSTTRWRRRPGGKRADMGRSMGRGCSVESRSLRMSLELPFSSSARTVPTSEKGQRSRPVFSLC
ncbi:hypothetical protein HYQ46_009429 [Verticillium longisporum]|nr:hypothetical protein HYQ46_009429 [Verticillium longisporum]